MAGSPRRRRPRRGPTHEQAEARVAELRKHRAASRTTRENLDAPPDGDIRVTTTFPRHKLELIVDGQPVSELTVVDFRQQIGGQTVRMGGIASVGTHRDHRLRGYGRRVLEGSLRWMRREGFETSMLYGIPSYYPKFGFAQAFPSLHFSLPVRDAERAAARRHRFVGFTGRHLRAVLRMYHANNAGRTGPTRRDPKHWRPFRQGMYYNTRAVCRVAVDARGRPVGYFVYDSGHLTATIIEVGFATAAVFGDILRAAARLALRQRLEEIRLILPEDDAFVEFCKPLGLRETVRYRADSGGQVRMINIPSALRSAAGELGGRMSGSGRLTVRTNLDDVHLAWSRGKLRVAPPPGGTPQARLPQWAMAQLLYGYRRADGLAAEGTLKAAGWAVAALEEMFPPRPHFQYSVDHF